MSIVLNSKGLKELKINELTNIAKKLPTKPQLAVLLVGK